MGQGFPVQGKEIRMFRKERLLGAGLVLTTVLFGIFPGVIATAKADTATDSQIDAEVHKALDNKKFQNVSVSVHDSNVTLTGTVELYADKEAVDGRVHHVKKVKGVDNELQVAGPQTSDVALRDKLAKQLSYYTVGYGTTTFTSINLGVQNGVVTLSGTVYWPPDKNAAIGLVANTPGVKDIVDNIQVAPVSPMDDQLRLQLARVIYGTPQLQKYAIDPAKPIRIMVVNGNVTLTGMVDDKMDRDIAGIKANTVPGVFKVVNDLQVAAPQTGK
jgi:osmotically-inducible protein OsmY